MNALTVTPRTTLDQITTHLYRATSAVSSGIDSVRVLRRYDETVERVAKRVQCRLMSVSEALSIIRSV